MTTRINYPYLVQTNNAWAKYCRLELDNSDARRGLCTLPPDPGFGIAHLDGPFVPDGQDHVRLTGLLLSSRKGIGHAEGCVARAHGELLALLGDVFEPFGGLHPARRLAAAK